MSVVHAVPEKGLIPIHFKPLYKINNDDWLPYDFHFQKYILSYTYIWHFHSLLSHPIIRLSVLRLHKFILKTTYSLCAWFLHFRLRLILKGTKPSPWEKHWMKFTRKVFSDNHNTRAQNQKYVCNSFSNRGPKTDLCM